MNPRSLPFALTALLLTTGIASAQEPLPHRVVDYRLDSGPVVHHGEQPASIYRQEILVEDAVWLRLFFSRAELGSDPVSGAGTTLRVTSLADGSVQDHTPLTLAQWRGSTAFFNGDRVRVELIADPGAPPSRLVLARLMVGEASGDELDSICGPDDDRTLSDSARTARVAPINCTGWMIDDDNHCFLSAGHCGVSSSFQVIEFNVPLSEPNGSVNHPPPEDQYAIDPASMQVVNGGVGNDWAYFGGFANTQTGLTPFQAQGEAYTLGDPPATVGGETIRIVGYGSVSGTQGTPESWNFVQKEHTGPLDSVSPTTLRYVVDTTGGNSGSPVFNDDTGLAIGIHTHGGCFSSGAGANNGTSILVTGLQDALANPLGVCLPDNTVFEDGFESGDLTSWSAFEPVVS